MKPTVNPRVELLTSIEPIAHFTTGSTRNAASGDLKGDHYDANAFVNELIDRPVRRAQYGQSLTVSHSLPHQFALSAEVWRFTQPFLRSNAVGNLSAVSYQTRKTLVFDIGYDEGLTRTSTQHELLFGFTYLLPHRLWGK